MSASPAFGGASISLKVLKLRATSSSLAIVLRIPVDEELSGKMRRRYKTLLPPLFLLFSCISGLNGKTVEYKHGYHQLLTGANFVNSLRKTNAVPDYVSDVNVEDNSINAIDRRVFRSGGKVGEALRQVWENMARRIGGLENRVNLVERQTADILNRLTTIDCSSLPRDENPTGIYTLYLDHRGTHSVQTLCDQDTEGGGWTVILQRIPHETEALATNFSRELREYKVGFGEPTGDFWIGLENIHAWTTYRDYQLRIDLEDFDNKTAFAHYDRFYVESERHGYKLHVYGYQGSAGDGLGARGKSDNFTADGMMFSTYDEDRDTSHEINCSSYWNIGGWWFNRCSWANLMGPYRLPGSGEGIGINWHKWRNKQYIKAATMKIRPRP